MSTPTEIFGSDFGDTVFSQALDTEVSFKGPRYIEAPEIEGSIVALRRLKEERFGDNIFIISKCEVHNEQQIKDWCVHHNFYERSGIGPERFRYCREYHDKAPICKELGITHFIDDRLQILGYLVSVPHKYRFGRRHEEDEPFGHLASHVTQIDAWDQLLKKLL